MATSKNRPSLSPLVVFLLGAASATVLLLFVLTATARPAWPALETGPHSGSGSVRCSTPRANGTVVAAEQHTGGVRAPPANETGASESDDDADEFARMLRRAAMEDRTVIMTSVNKAWAAPGSLLDSFLESFRVGENVSHFVKHIVVVAMDGGAFRRCQAVHPHCHLLRPEKEGLDLSGAKSYMTKDYLDLVWSKLKLQQRILELGYNLLFTARTRRGRGVVPEPAGAHHDGGGHHDVERLLLRQPGRPGQLPQHGLHLLQVDAPERPRHGVLARGAAAVPGEPRPVRVQRDQAGAREQAGRPDPVHRRRHRQRLLPAGQGPQPRRHRAHDLLRRAGEQAVRPQEGDRGLEALHGAPAVGAPDGEDRMDVRGGKMHTLTALRCTALRARVCVVCS